MATPVVAQISSLLSVIDLIGISGFAASGALMAARRGDTFVTAAFFALLTGVGSGAIRDLLISSPVWWVHHPWISGLCVGAALAVWITPQHWWSEKALDWLDAMGMAAYSVFGTAKALAFGVPPVPAAMVGVVAACAGGIIRDIIAGEPSILLRPELYVTAAALGTSLYVVLVLLGVPTFPAGVGAATAAFCLRGAAIIWNVKLPSYRNRREEAS